MLLSRNDIEISQRFLTPFFYFKHSTETTAYCSFSTRLWLAKNVNGMCDVSCFYDCNFGVSALLTESCWGMEKECNSNVKTKVLIWVDHSVLTPFGIIHIYNVCKLWKLEWLYNRSSDIFLKELWFIIKDAGVYRYSERDQIEAWFRDVTLIFLLLISFRVTLNSEQ